ncbi:amidohydrolase family protein [Paraburkholderia jirisanensis]
MTERVTLFKGGAIITMDGRMPNLPIGDILVRGKRIEAIAPDIQVHGADIIDATGCILLPGFIDAHHHVWLGVMRRLMPDCTDLFAYIDLVAEKMGAEFRPHDMYVSTRLTAVAALDAGITTIVDAAHNTRSPEHSDASIDALRDAGIRALHLVGSPMDKQGWSSHLPQDIRRLAAKWNPGEGLVKVGLFGHLKLDLDWWKLARELEIPLLTELVGDFNRIPAELADLDLIGPKTIFNHCTRIPAETWKLLADRGASITVNPRSDVIFGFDDDSFAYQKAIDYGFKPALGIDVQTTYGSDMFGEMRALFQLQRAAMRYRQLRGDARASTAVTVEAVLQAATVNGAAVVGQQKTIGTLTPGKEADLIMVRTDSIGVFPVTHAIGAIVHAVERSDVDTVMVAGAIRKRGGRLIDVDVSRLARDVEASRARLAQACGYTPDLFGST